MTSNPNRDDLGRLVRETRVAYCYEIGDTKESHLVEWDALPEIDKEADRCIGTALVKLGMQYYQAVANWEAPNAALVKWLEKHLPENDKALARLIAPLLRRDIPQFNPTTQVEQVTFHGLRPDLTITDNEGTYTVPFRAIGIRVNFAYTPVIMLYCAYDGKHDRLIMHKVRL